MKIKTAFIIETCIRILVLIVMFPFLLTKAVLLTLAKPFEWILKEVDYFVTTIGHKLFLKSKMAHYVENEEYKRILTARSAYRLKRQLLEEQPDLSENEL